MPLTKKILIKNGVLVSNREAVKKNILLKGEKVIAVGKLSNCQPDQIIEADGLLVMPGAVDSHVHFNDEFMQTVSVHDYYTGTLAAAYGGVTSIIDFSNQEKGGSLLDTIENKKKQGNCDNWW